MPSLFSTQLVVSGELAPSNNGYTPIPGLATLALNDDELQFGGSAYINLFLGQVDSGAAISFNLYVGFIDTSTGDLFWETCITGGNGLLDVLNLSTTYTIQANVKPAIQAVWQIKGSTGLQVVAPTTITFSAMVFENMG